MGTMTDLEWLLWEYCHAIWKIQCGQMDYEDRRQRVHDEIAEHLGCEREHISPVLHNIDYTQRDGYNYHEAANTLERLKEQKLI